jgi:hypothetical protein
VTVVAKRILDIQPIRFIPQLHKWLELAPLSDDDKARVIDLAGEVGYTEESSVVNWPPYTDRVRLNDPAGEGYHRDYLARIES